MKKIMFNDRYGLTQAVIEGRKAMTRRIIKAPKRINGQEINGFIVCKDIATQEITGIYARDYNGASIEDCEILPRYDFGETVAVAQSYRGIVAEFFETDASILRASELHRLAGWANKMFVKAELMLHQIRITGIRYERLQDISDADCLKEGIRYIPEINKFYFEDIRREEGFYFNTPREAFAALIDRISGRVTWDRNPYVVVYQFELVK